MPFYFATRVLIKVLKMKFEKSLFFSPAGGSVVTISNVLTWDFLQFLLHKHLKFVFPHLYLHWSTKFRCLNLTYLVPTLDI